MELEKHIENAALRNFFCSRCGRFLGSEYIIIGKVSFKCPDRRCKHLNIIEIVDFDQLYKILKENSS